MIQNDNLESVLEDVLGSFLKTDHGWFVGKYEMTEIRSVRMEDKRSIPQYTHEE